MIKNYMLIILSLFFINLNQVDAKEREQKEVAATPTITRPIVESSDAPDPIDYRAELTQKQLEQLSNSNTQDFLFNLTITVCGPSLMIFNYAHSGHWLFYLVGLGVAYMGSRAILNMHKIIDKKAEQLAKYGYLY